MVRAWVAGLRALIRAARAVVDHTDYHLREEFVDLCRNYGGAIPIAVALDVFAKNNQLPPMQLRELSAFSAKFLLPLPDEVVSTFAEYWALYLINMLFQRPELVDIFCNHCSPQACAMSLEQVGVFLREEQGEADADLARCLQILHRYELSPVRRREKELSLLGFAAYILSREDGCLLQNRIDWVHQDMSQPLAHYFINSSHNTYVVDHQMRGESSVEMYIQSLLRSCRCVEIDCWNGDDGQPIVTHAFGRNSTYIAQLTKIKFADVVKAIAKYAFVMSPYPVILSLENHCNEAQQRVMAACMEEHFGDYLLSDFLPDVPPDQLPSPEQLMFKILLKNKKVSYTHELVRSIRQVANSDTAVVTDGEDVLSPEEEQLDLINAEEDEDKLPDDASLLQVRRGSAGGSDVESGTKSLPTSSASQSPRPSVSPISFAAPPPPDLDSPMARWSSHPSPLLSPFVSPTVSPLTKSVLELPTTPPQTGSVSKRNSFGPYVDASLVPFLKQQNGRQRRPRSESPSDATNGAMGNEAASPTSNKSLSSPGSPNTDNRLGHVSYAPSIGGSTTDAEETREDPLIDNDLENAIVEDQVKIGDDAAADINPEGSGSMGAFRTRSSPLSRQSIESMVS